MSFASWFFSVASVRLRLENAEMEETISCFFFFCFGGRSGGRLFFFLSHVVEVASRFRFWSGQLVEAVFFFWWGCLLGLF